MKVLIHAPCPWWPTGMGGQAGLLGRMLWELGHRPSLAPSGQTWAAIDGEPARLTSPVEFRVKPGALRVLVPRPPARPEPS